MSVATNPQRYGAAVPPRAPDMVRWGPVVAAAVIGLGFFALVDTLWLAIAYSGDGTGWVSGNIAWFIGATAAVSLLLAGIVAGALAGVRGMAAGLANGVTAWGLLFILSLTAIIPGAVNLTGMLGAGLQEGSTEIGGGFLVESALWATFWSLLIGLVLAAIGGVVGGRLRRPVDPPQEATYDYDVPVARSSETMLGERQTVEVDPARERR